MLCRKFKQPAETPVSLPASPITNVTPASPPEEDAILPASVIRRVKQEVKPAVSQVKRPVVIFD